MSRYEFNKKLIECLLALGTFTHAVTLNLKKFHYKYGVANNKWIAERTGKHVLNSLNREIFRHKYRKGQRSIGGVVALEQGEHGEMWHLHCAFAMPSNMKPEEFETVIKKVAHSLDWIKGAVHIQDVYSDGWLEYITKCGMEAVVEVSKAR